MDNTGTVRFFESIISLESPMGFLFMLEISVSSTPTGFGRASPTMIGGILFHGIHAVPHKTQSKLANHQGRPKVFEYMRHESLKEIFYSTLDLHYSTKVNGYESKLEKLGQ